MTTSLRKSVGMGKQKDNWFWSATPSKGRTRRPRIGPSSWEGLNGALSVFAKQVNEDADNRDDFATCIQRELFDVVRQKGQEHKKKHEDALARYRSFAKRLEIAEEKVSKAKAQLKSKAKEEGHERQKYDQMLKHVEETHKELERRGVKTMSDEDQERAAREQVHLSKQLATQKTRWTHSCSVVDVLVEKVGELQTEAETARMALDNAVKETGRCVTRTEIERVFLLRIAMQSLVEQETEYHKRRLKQIDRFKELLRTVDADTDLRLATHNEVVRARIAKVCSDTGGEDHGDDDNDGPSSTHVIDGTADDATHGFVVVESQRKRHSMSRSELEMERLIHRYVAYISDDGSEDADAEERKGQEGGSKVEGTDDSGERDTSSSESDATIEPRVVQLFKMKAAREMFIRELNRQRSSNKSMGRSGFKSLSKTMKAFLDACVSHRDVKAATMLMIMSQTFFRAPSSRRTVDDAALKKNKDEGTASDSSKEFVQWTIAGHPIWKDPLFWEEAFLHIVREEVEKNHSSFVSKGSTGDAKRLEEAEYHYKQIVFGQLGSIAVNMISFGMALSATRAFIMKMCVANDLSEDEMKALISIASNQQTVRQRRMSSSISMLSSPTTANVEGIEKNGDDTVPKRDDSEEPPTTPTKQIRKCNEEGDDEVDLSKMLKAGGTTPARERRYSGNV